MTSADDEINLLKEGWRLLGRHVESELIARGWAIADLDAADDAPLEFFWPPTAPIGYGGSPDWSSEASRKQPEMHDANFTPWITPTRIAFVDSRWRVEYGAAIAQEPAAPIEHIDDQALLDDLARIEWWPMPVAEARRLQHERVLHTTYADAFDQHARGYSLKTEPYASRLREVSDRIRGGMRVTMADPDAWRWAGDLRARMRIIDGEMWASAVRTARAGGEERDLGRPPNTPDDH